MVGAGAFAVAIGASGYMMQGWTFALAGPAAFLAALLPLNFLALYAVGRLPRLNPIVTLQAVKWILAAVVGTAMAALAPSPL